MSERCVSQRKDGKPCQGQGLFNHPELNGLVCDAHRPDGPGSASFKLGMELKALQWRAEAQKSAEAQDALTLRMSRGFSDKTLSTVLEALRHFRNGDLLTVTVRKLLEDVLEENTLRKSRQPGKGRRDQK